MVKGDKGLPLVLGTAQLGMPYGIANDTGKPELNNACSLIKAAWDEGIDYYDTAQSYGDSEQVLGYAFRRIPGTERARIITKIDPNITDPVRFRESILQSLSRLNLPVLFGVLLHREEYLEDWNIKWGPALRKIRSLGLIEHLGVSIYSPASAEKALACEGLDLLQFPANIFDRRILRSGLVDRLASSGITLFMRSIFLQGLILMEPYSLPPAMNFARKALETLDSFCLEHSLDKKTFAMHYGIRRFPGAKIIFGAERIEQVLENCRIVAQEPVSEKICHLWDQAYPEDKERLVNPSLWQI